MRAHDLHLQYHVTDDEIKRYLKNEDIADRVASFVVATTRKRRHQVSLYADKYTCAYTDIFAHGQANMHYVMHVSSYLCTALSYQYAFAYTYIH